MRVRAKFQCTSITRQHNRGWSGTPPSETHTVHFMPVSGNDSEENRKFWEATPSGKVEIGCAKAETAGLFELGKDYYLDFTPADESSDG